jgi:copper resistance protein C
MIVGRAVIAAMLLCWAAASYAHAFVDHAAPRVGATVSSAPPEVRIWFNQELEPAYSQVKVLNAAGAQVDKSDARVDATDPALLRVSLEALGPGVYKVVWRVISVDAHVTEGDFTFRVGH